MPLTISVIVLTTTPSIDGLIENDILPNPPVDEVPPVADTGTRLLNVTPCVIV